MPPTGVPLHRNSRCFPVNSAAAGIVPPSSPAQIEEALIDLPLPAPRNFWLLEDDGVPIGRIGANVSSRIPQSGYLGFFEVDTRHAGAGEAALELIGAACAFLQGKVSRVCGPVNFNTWLPYRFRVNECDERCFAWEPVNPPDYVDYFSCRGIRAQYGLPLRRLFQPRPVSGADRS